MCSKSLSYNAMVYSFDMSFFKTLLHTVEVRYVVSDACTEWQFKLHLPLNCPLPGWVYYQISNAMQYSNTTMETISLVMGDSNTFSYCSANFINIHCIS